MTRLRRRATAVQLLAVLASLVYLGVHVAVAQVPDPDGHYLPPARSGRFATRVWIAADAIERAWPVEAQRRALLVADCESRFDPRARNYESGMWGLFQIAMPLHAELVAEVAGEGADLLNPYTNAAVAAELYRRYGWAPWYSTRGCWSS